MVWSDERGTGFNAVRGKSVSFSPVPDGLEFPRAGERKKGERDKTSRWLPTALGIAKRFGVYVIETGPKDDPAWYVHSLKTGRLLVCYYPKTGNYLTTRGQPSKGKEKDWKTLFSLAAEIDNL